MQAYCVGQMLASNKGIPFDADIFFEEIASGDMGNTSSHSQLQSPELANQPLIQIQTSSVDLSHQVDRESHQFSELYNPINSSRVSVPTRFPDIGHSARMPISSSHGNHVRINQLPTSVASSECVPTFESQYQNQNVRTTEENHTDARFQ